MATTFAFSAPQMKVLNRLPQGTIVEVLDSRLWLEATTAEKFEAMKKSLKRQGFIFDEIPLAKSQFTVRLVSAF